MFLTIPIPSHRCLERYFSASFPLWAGVRANRVAQTESRRQLSRPTLA